MQKIVFFSLSILFLGQYVLSSDNRFSSKKWITPDFFVATATSNQSLLFTTEPENCREKISQMMCLVDRQPEGDRGKDRECLEGGKDYAKYFESLYDHYPEAIQRIFCSLKVIYIEKQFNGTAYAGLLQDEQGNILGAQMGMRKSVLDEGLNLATWASWKEQLSFGGIKDSYQILEDLPIIQTASSHQVNGFLYFVVAHEFGHIFDFANKLNKCKSEEYAQRWEEDPSVECEMDDESFGALSWLTDRRLKSEYEFPNRRELCFYWCDGKILDKTVIPQIYRDLDKSNLISIYATTQPFDDFAESLAYFLMSQHLGASYIIDTKQGDIYNVMEKITSDRFHSKFEYVRDFLNRRDITYP